MTPRETIDDRLAERMLTVLEQAHELRVLIGRLLLAQPYDEDGYCLWCGNGSWKHHHPDCAWADAKDLLAESYPNLGEQS